MPERRQKPPREEIPYETALQVYITVPNFIEPDHEKKIHPKVYKDGITCACGSELRAGEQSILKSLRLPSFLHHSKQRFLAGHIDRFLLLKYRQSTSNAGLLRSRPRLPAGVPSGRLVHPFFVLPRVHRVNSREPRGTHGQG